MIKLRQLVRCRSAIVKGRTRNKNLIHAILLQDGTRIGALPFSAGFTDRLHGLDDWRIEAYLAAIGTDNRNVAACDARIQEAVDGCHEARLLKTIPGVGNYTALTLVAAIGDISRFSDMDKMAAYFGTVPSVRSSAETVVHGRITRTGDSLVRHVISEATLVHVTWAGNNKRPTPISTFYERLAKKRGGSKAKVAAGAKMLRMIFWMLKKDIDFWTCIEEGRKSTEGMAKKRLPDKKGQTGKKR